MKDILNGLWARMKEALHKEQKAKRQSEVFPLPPSRHEWGEGLQRKSFLPSALYEGDWSNLRPGGFALGKGRRYTTNRRVDGPHSLTGLLEKKSIVPTGFRTADCPARGLIATNTFETR
jgi:hypothetical protein